MRLIDADALVEEMLKADMPPHDIGGRYQTGFMDARSMVILAPTIEPKKGKWIRHGLKSVNVPWGYDCSACGAWFVVGDDTVEKFDCCPKCGARMERSEE